MVSAAPHRLRISPRAAALARRSVINPAPIRGTGPGGRIVEKDVLAYLEVKGYAQLKITPTAKDLAAKEQLDLPRVARHRRGRQDHGRGYRTRRGREAQGDEQDAAGDCAAAHAELHSTPHFFVTVSVDMTDLIAYRATLKAKSLPYSVTDFIAMAVTLS